MNRQMFIVVCPLCGRDMECWISDINFDLEFSPKRLIVDAISSHLCPKEDRGLAAGGS